MDPCVAIDVQTLVEPLSGNVYHWVSLAGDCSQQQLQSFWDLSVTLLFHPFRGWI